MAADSLQRGAAGKHVYLTHDVAARELAPGVCAAAYVTALQASPLPSTITTSVLVDNTPLRTQWQVRLAPHHESAGPLCRRVGRRNKQQSSR